MSKKDSDVYGTENDNIPADVLEVMGKSGIGDVETGSDTGDIETNLDDDTGNNQDDSDDKGDTRDTDEVDKDTDDKEDDEGNGDSDEDSKTTGDSEDTEPVPQEHITIGRRYGWSDEKIIKMSEEHPDILEDMGNLIGRQSQPAAEQKVVPAATQKQEVKGVDKVELDGEALKKMKDNYGDEVVDSVILPLMGGLNKTIDQLNTLRGTVSGVEETNQANQAKKNFDEANTVFDGLTETFTVFGKTDELPKLADGKYDVNSPAVQVRGKVFKVALAFQASGMSWTDSLKEATRWYKGEHAEKSLERKIVKDLVSRKKKFSPRPTSKKTKQTFKSREDEGIALVRKAYK